MPTKSARIPMLCFRLIFHSHARIPERSMALSEADVLTCLKNVVDPNTGRDFVTAKEIKKVTVNGADVGIDLALGYPAKSQHESLKKLIQGAVAALPGAGRVTVNVTT